MRRIARTSSAVLLLFLLTCVTALPASAHAVIVTSYPGNGAEVFNSPPQIRLSFSEGVRLQFSGFSMSDTNGRTFHVTPKTVTGDQSQIQLSGYGELPTGVYVVGWHIMSASDSHITTGHIIFGVGTSVPQGEAVAAASEPVSSAEVVLRWVDILFAALLVGGLAITAIALRAGSESFDEIRRRALRVPAWAGVAALTMGLVLFGWQVQRVHGAGPGDSWIDIARPLLTQGRYAALWWTREFALAGLTVIAFRLRRRARDETGGRLAGVATWSLTGVLVVALALTRALGSHAASAQYSAWAVFVDTLHIVAALFWMGGLFVLMYATWPVLSRPKRNPAAAITAWRRFGLLAVISFGVLAATGVFEAARQVASIDGLLFSSYGKALVAKTVLALVLATLGAANAMLLHPKIRARIEGSVGTTPKSRSPRLPRLVAYEAAAGVAAFLMVAIMTSASPPRGAEFLPGSGPVLPSTFFQAADLNVTVSVTPNLPGSNQVSAQIVSSFRPSPPDPDPVTVTFTSPSGKVTSPVILSPEAYNTYAGGGDQLDQPGTWHVVFSATRTGYPVATHSYDFVVGSGPAVRKPVISVAPIGRALTAAGIAALVALFGGLLLLLLLACRQGGGTGDRPIPPTNPDLGADGAELADMQQPALAGRSRERDGP
jgi:copper transport protein